MENTLKKIEHLIMIWLSKHLLDSSKFNGSVTFHFTSGQMVKSEYKGFSK